MRFLAAAAVMVCVACASSRPGADPPDAAVDAAGDGDAAPTDGSPPIDAAGAMTCESCEGDLDCADGWLCRPTGAGAACLPRCDAGSPICPAGFTCAGVKDTYCTPLDGICCVEDDDDNYGTGLGCLGADCDDQNGDRNPGEAELCDGFDNDCDAGSMDGADEQALGMPCDGGDSDLCNEGARACTGGVLGCSDTSGDNVELCDGVDNDCITGTPDGSGDPSVGITCDGPDGDMCREGLASCTPAGGVQCSDETGTTADICNNMDDDCDQATPDGAADPMLGMLCGGIDGDLCREGTYTCSGTGLSCSDATSTTADLCNNLDDDCNMATPDGSADPMVGAQCDGADSDLCLEGLRVCAMGMLACSDNSADDVEVCDNMNNDCDLATDEGFDTTSDPLNCGMCGNACGGLCCSSSCTPSSATNCGACGHACTAGMLVIDEALIDPAAVSDVLGEWFEIYNPNPWAIDLRGFVIRDLGTDTHTITSSVPVVVPAQGYAVLAVNANSASNGGVTVLYQYAGVDLGNSGDELRIDAFSTLLDELVWPSNFDVSGRSKELSVNHRTAAQNDTLTNWCSAVTVYGAGDRGTPGAANACAL